MVERVTNGDFSITVADGTPVLPSSGRPPSTGADPAGWVVIEPGDTAGTETADDIIQVGGGKLVFSGGDSPTTGSVEQTITGLPIGKEATFSADYGENASGTDDVSVRFQILDGSGNVIFEEDVTTIGTTVNFTFTTTVPTYTIRISDTSPSAGIGRDATVDNVSLDVACFVSGTQIHTENGDFPVEDLKVGDQVLTADGSYQTIRWIGHSQVPIGAHPSNENLRPIRIQAGALGSSLPVRDLLVSPQHRMLVRSKIAQRMFDTPEVLVAAKKLLPLSGVCVDRDVENVSYFHIAFDKHEVIFAENCPTESFYPGPEAMNALSDEARAEFSALFPQIHASDAQTPISARPIPEGRLQKKLIERHMLNGQEINVN